MGLDRVPSARAAAPWTSKIGPEDGCGKETVHLAVERWYNASELGVIWEVSDRMGSAGIAAAVRLGMAGLFASCMLLGRPMQLRSVGARLR